MIIYHASQNKDLKLIKPQKTISNNKYIGDYVFATKNKLLALMYLTPKGIPILMDANSKKPNLVICSSPIQFNELDKGGALYELSDKFFSETPQKGLDEHEMVSIKSVKPLRKTVFNNILNTFLIEGIYVRFTDEKKFNELIGNANQKKLILELPVYAYHK